MNKGQINLTAIFSTASILLAAVGLASGWVGGNFKEVNAKIETLGQTQTQTSVSVAVLQEQYKNINDKLDIIIGTKPKK